MRNATQIQTFEQAADVFEAKAKTSRTYVEGVKAVRIGHNLTVRLTPLGDYAIRYHQTDIVVYTGTYGKFVKVSNGGWNSVTTCSHLHTFTPPHLRFNGRYLARGNGTPTIYVTNTDDDSVEVVTAEPRLFHA